MMSLKKEVKPNTNTSTSFNPSEGGLHGGGGEDEEEEGKVHIE